MPKDREGSQPNWSTRIGFGAVVGVLVSAIVGMLRLSKPRDGKKPQPAEKATSDLTNESASNQTSEEAGTALQRQSAQRSAMDFRKSTDVIESEPTATTHWRTSTKYFVAALLFLAFLGVLYISSSSISTIIFAALLTFIVHPIIKLFQRRLKMRRGGATLVTYLLVLALLLLIPILIIPSIVNSIQFLAGIDYLALLENASEWLQQQASVLGGIPLVGRSVASSLEDLARIFSDVALERPESSTSFDISFRDIGGGISQTLAFLSNVFGPLVSIVTTVVFVLLISLHMSLSVDMLRDGARKLVPEAYQPEISVLIRRIILIWNSFLRGQMSLMVVVGVIVWIGNLILGTPQALLLGVLAGILEVIPSLGPILATIPAVIIALLFGSTNFPIENWAFALIVIVFYVLVQVIENQLLVPYILGDAVDLPPLIVIIGVVIGGSAFGLLGVFLATPVISTGREIFMYLYNKILEPPPEPEVIEEKTSIMDTIRGFAARLPRPRWRRSASETLPAPVEESVSVEQI